MLSQRGAPAFLAWVGAPGGNPRLAPGGRGYGEPAHDEDAKGQWRHTQVILAPMWFPSSRTCNVMRHCEPKLKRERTWNCPNCGDQRHDRNLNAAINLRNLIMPAGRSRDGPGQEAMGQQGWTASRLRGHLGSGEHERDPGAGTKAGVPGLEARITES